MKMLCFKFQQNRKINGGFDFFVGRGETPGGKGHSHLYILIFSFPSIEINFIQPLPELKLHINH